ncbi:DNA polymerase Y family protein [Homoserinibacter sp. YIM 151385]|uniref:DNA polymerase Y family protein n=1 Tax=Homoserinibacter sp. YIM 151385 TaxID=2985506 RepID=UPI0022F001A7|nr:DNA polymerase Y family protein [Homoserinibacter sp. YIM 151385]WBU38562.1 DNA polymerase Y family protein [Homoserinibacter sp. YIM 151385]
MFEERSRGRAAGGRRRSRAAVAEGVAAPRLLAIWAPDWPVAAHMAAERIPEGAPVALVLKGEVHACSAAARHEGVRRGLRVREAQARCPGLRVLAYDAALDARAFEPVIAGLEAVLPGVHPVRPGTLAVAARGPARYYGGEQAAALAILAAVGELGVRRARAGVAEGLFAAERAARAPREDAPVTIVPAGDAAAFLAPLPVRLLEQPELVQLLPRLGIRTLGEFAALGEAEVAERFGPGGARLHALAGGRDLRAATPRIPPRDLDAEARFEPPLERVDQVAFALRAPAAALVDGLLEERLVATALRVVLTGEEGETSERVWLHPRSFTAAEVVDRVRWQLQGALERDGGAAALRSPVAAVRVSPETVEPLSGHERGLWGTGPDEGVHSGLSRIQGMVGHRGVLTPAPSGGRRPVDRQALVPWGDRPIVARDPGQPWPGALPPPAPATVYEVPRPLRVDDRRGRPVAVDERGRISGAPAVLVSGTGARRDVTSWAGPWPIEERWWDPVASRRAHRFQLVDAEGAAWLLVLDDSGWWAEGRYD